MVNVSSLFRAGCHRYHESGELIERGLRTGYGIAQLANAPSARAGFLKAWDLVYLTRILADFGEIVTLGAFIETKHDGSLKVENGKYVWKNTLASAARVALFAARVLFFTIALHTAKAVTIKAKHIVRMSYTIAGTWLIVAIGAFGMAANDLHRQPYNKQACADLVLSGFDCASVIFDLCKTASRSCAIASAIFHIGAGFTALLYESAWHRKV